MIVTENLFKLDDQIENLVETILQSNSLIDYKINRKEVYRSTEVATKQRHFLQAKDAFEQIEAFGAYLPEVRTKKIELRQAKRVLDLDETVANFRKSETEMQLILDTIGTAVAETISKDIKVDAGNPFFTKGKHSGCGGNCHAS